MSDIFQVVALLRKIEQHLRPWSETSEKTSIPPYHIDLRADPDFRPRSHHEPVPFVDRDGWHNMPGDVHGRLHR